MQAPRLEPEEEMEVIDWIDNIQFSRTKKNFNRDFADGVLVAELVHQFFPSKIDCHNYPTANSSSQKYNNWNTLNIFKKVFGFEVNKNDIEQIISGADKVILRVLRLIYLKFEQYSNKLKQKQQKRGSKQQRQQQKIDLSLSDKDLAIKELRQTIEILELKLKKMDQLNKLKDAKIQTLTNKLNQQNNR